jgi:hypothetical protein
MTGTPEPVSPAPAAPAPAASPVITLSAADLAQLLAAAGHRVVSDVKTDASPSKVVSAVKAIPSEIEAMAKATNWPLTIVACIAVVALAMHFPAMIDHIFKAL